MIRKTACHRDYDGSSIREKLVLGERATGEQIGCVGGIIMPGHGPGEIILRVVNLASLGPSINRLVSKLESLFPSLVLTFGDGVNIHLVLEKATSSRQWLNPCGLHVADVVYTFDEHIHTAKSHRSCSP
jgi:hypothetical protein